MPQVYTTPIYTFKHVSRLFKNLFGKFLVPPALKTVNSWVKRSIRELSEEALENHNNLIFCSKLETKTPLIHKTIPVLRLYATISIKYTQV